jgi:hypothetical protein
MHDNEHQEWLGNQRARKAAQKKSKPLPLPKKVDDEKRRETPDDGAEPMSRGEY